MSTSICNETVERGMECRPLTLRIIVTNEYFLYAVSLLAFFGSWHWAAASGVLGGGSALATPWEVLERLWEMTSETLGGQTLWVHMWASTERVLLGFAIAALLAVPLGLAMALNPYVNAVAKPLFDMLKPMPPLAWISLAILWFGIQEAPKIFLIVIGAFVPCLLNAYNGIRLIDPELYDVVRVQGGNRWDEIRLVSIPGALPAISAGLQISLSSAWTCVLAAELISSRSGLGYIIMQGMKMSDPGLVMGGMIIIALISWLTSQTMDRLDRRLCPWQREIKGL